MMRRFGDTGLTVSALGFGAGHIGANDYSDKEAELLLNEVLDLGINLIDTARGYGESERRIGTYISHRRDEYVLSTKIGYGIPGFEDWTGPCIRAGVEAALKLLNTDVLDIVHLHSCPLETLKSGEVVEELLKAVDAGKVRVAAYSGENEALDYALESGVFGSVQHSVNICDQQAIGTQLSNDMNKDIGVIAKRPIANAPWKYAERPVGQYVEDYWVRFRDMGFDRLDIGLPWDEIALRFTAFTSGVHSCIVGTGSPSRVQHNLKLLAKGPLDESIVQALRSTFAETSQNWKGLI